MVNTLDCIGIISFYFRTYRPRLVDVRFAVSEYWFDLKAENHFSPPEARLSVVTRVVYVVRAAIQEITRPARYSWCHIVHGHDRWVDESYGNPESGGDGGYCDRCGHSFWVQYY